MEQRDWRVELKKAGKKSTRQRIAILSILAANPHSLTAEEVFLQVLERQKTSLSTIYRNLELLIEEDIVARQGFPGEKARYTLRQHAHAHHLVCLLCQKVVSIADCPLESYSQEIGEREHFQVTHHRMEMYGYCADCSLKEVRKDES